jgi:hypothetical protein
MFGPLKAAIGGFIFSMTGFLLFHYFFYPGGLSDPRGMQNLINISTPIAGLIAGVIFVIACLCKAASRSE